jgi:uncharacterized protein (TIGR02598 family)
MNIKVSIEEKVTSNQVARHVALAKALADLMLFDRAMVLPNSRRSSSGLVCPSLSAFSLVEVLLSVFILTISAMALFGCFSAGFLNMRMARENQRAIQIVLDRTETIRVYNWDQVNQSGFVPATFTNYYDPQAAIGHQGTIYSGTITVSAAPINASYSNDMKQLTINVNWQTGNVPRTRQCTTYIGRNGIQNYLY